MQCAGDPADRTRLALWFILLSASAVATSASAQEIKYGPDPDAEKRTTLLLKDFDPQSMLHSETHDNHVNDPGGVHGQQVPPAEVVKGVDQANVKKVVILTGLCVGLPDGILEKAYHGNAEKIFAQFRGGKSVWAA